MIKIKKIAMQLCLSSAVLAEMPAFAAEAVQSSARHYVVKNLNIGDLPVKTIVPIILLQDALIINIPIIVIPSVMVIIIA